MIKTKLPPIFLGCLSLCLLAFLANAQKKTGRISGELKKWHRVTLTFDGPKTGEDATPNPFRDYRLDVTFSKDNRKIVAPGFYAADGAAAETGATAGNQWRVHFMPDEEGEWRYTASFRMGADVAVSDQASAGKPAAFDGASGRFTIAASDKSGRDFRAQGALRYVGKHYLQFAGTKEHFIKGGADSPENFLAYYEFDGTPAKHRYEPHAGDWKDGDPTWQSGKGKNIIGALNYLASKGMNSVYFLTMNVAGDGKDVWPWTNDQERFRFDCSKLDQWEIVFSHMDKLGLMLHVITQETENDQLLDQGALGPERRLYYRELIARFAHHPALVWNLGEENTNTDEQRKAFSEYFHSLDPYDHPVVVHTYPRQYDRVYDPLLGFAHLEGPSLQMGDMRQTHFETIKWIDRSALGGRNWFVCLDEIGPAKDGALTDAEDPEHNDVRRYALWGNLLAGGAGVEWYFGYQHPHNDLNCEDWRSRDRLWDQTRYALEFFRRIPFTEMRHNDGLTNSQDDYCFANPGKVYAIYLPKGGSTDVDLGGAPAEFSVEWYNSRTGGALQRGSAPTLESPGWKSVGAPPSETDKDWIVLVKLIKANPRKQ
ncbi:MAG: DUF5060 domain-containing protein [Acidobacteria bacterium]|nr:DUF5060 domain-containing protein [Acidobacteriota bacterium]